MKISLDNAPLDRSGNTVLTTQLQQLIDEIASAGGGTLVVTPGIWLTGTLVLPLILPCIWKPVPVFAPAQTLPITSIRRR